MKKYFKKKFLFILSSVFMLSLSFGSTAFAQAFQIVPCKGAECGFKDIIGLITNIINFAFILVLPIAAIVFAYAGFQLITSGGDPGKRESAKKMMIKVGKGIIFILAAWLIVKTIVITLGVDTTTKTFFLGGRN